MEAAHGLETPDKGRTTDSLVEVRLCRLGSVLAMVAQPAADGAVLEATEEGATYHGDLVGGGLNHGRWMSQRASRLAWASPRRGDADG